MTVAIRMAPISINESLYFHAREKPQSHAFTFLEKEGNEKSSITFSQLDLAARTIARELRSLPIQSRIILALPSGLEFIQAFMGCLYAGMIAVPAYPPEGTQKRNRLYAIVRDCSPRLLITSYALKKKYEPRYLADNSDADLSVAIIPWVDIEDLMSSSPEENFKLPELSSQAIAFLQYTSGSTAAPKGVIISHENLFSNQQMIAALFRHDDNTVFASWLPLFHDMGLVGNILQPIYLGIPCYLMSPLNFIEKPVRWLEAISKYRVTTTGAPNFGYDLCVKRISAAQIASLNLDCWKVAYNGAEPIKAKTINDFSNKFQACGFSRAAMLPVYGMAEATLLVSGGDTETEPHIRYADKAKLAANQLVWSHQNINPDTTRYATLVGCGKAADGLDIKIVDPHTHIECKADSVGEIWLRGSNISSGYFNNHELNHLSFNQTILNGKLPHSYFKTGDLGALSNGQLYITGRIKDVVIVRGKNHYPQDLEQTISASSIELCMDGCAVFSWKDRDIDHVIAVQEVEKNYIRSFDPHPVAMSVQSVLYDEHGIVLDAILWVKPVTIPRTTSGKISRASCKQKYINGRLPYFSASINPNVNVIPMRKKEIC